MVARGRARSSAFNPSTLPVLGTRPPPELSRPPPSTRRRIRRRIITLSSACRRWPGSQQDLAARSLPCLWGSQAAHSTSVWYAVSLGAPQWWHTGISSRPAIWCIYLPKQPYPLSICVMRYVRVPNFLETQRSRSGQKASTVSHATTGDHRSSCQRTIRTAWAAALRRFSRVLFFYSYSIYVFKNSVLNTPKVL